MPPDDRERWFEKALSQSLRRDAPQEECPDAEVLAAYQERALELEQMIRWKHHVAGCARCQEVLARLETTEEIPVAAFQGEDEQIPVFEVPFIGQIEQLKVAGPIQEPRQPVREPQPPVPAPSPVLSKPQVKAPSAETRTPVALGTIVLPAPRQRPRWPWLVPAGAIAAGLLVWVAVRELRVEPIPTQVAMNRPRETNAPAAPAAPLANTYSAASQSVDKAAPQPKPSGEELASRRELMAEAQPPVSSQKEAHALPETQTPLEVGKGLFLRAPARSAPQALSKLKSGDEEGLDRLAANAKKVPSSAESQLEQNRLADAAQKAEATREDKQAQPSANAGAKEEIEVAAKPAPATPPPPPPTAAAAAPPGPAKVLDEKDSGGATAKLQYTPEVSAERKGLRAAQKTMRGTGTNTIRAPGNKVQWVIGKAGIILHSPDGGTNWVPQPSGVAVDLNAGSAPSDAVCWIVGDRGTVLLTTDGGEHWLRISSPTAADLIGVNARDAQNAAVWSEPPLPRYATQDGGKTWKQSSPE